MTDDGARRSAKTPLGEMHLMGGSVLMHRLRGGVVVTKRTADEVLRVTKEIADGEPVAVVVDMRKIAFADLEARNSFAADDAGEVATALLVSAPIAEFLAKRFVADSQPARPTRIFLDETEAVVWAADQVNGRS